MTLGQVETARNDRFKILAKHIRMIAEPMIEEHFGDRREDHFPECPICKRWAALDALLENPYE